MGDHHHHQSSFSNPIAPPGHVVQEEDVKPLSNEDFRKLVMSTRGTPGGATKERVLGMGHSVRGGRVSGSIPSTPNAASSSSSATRREEREASENRKKKKTEYLKLRKMEMEKEAELASKYRDRAKERRAYQDKEGEEGETGAAGPDKATQNYHAVNPNAEEGEAERRRNQIIEESKFLGGDIEHTHLVKGLDYALLHKVRAEIHSKQTEPIVEDVRVINGVVDTTTSSPKEGKDLPGEALAVSTASSASSGAKFESKSIMAKNIRRIVFHQLPERNELFAPGRMAYVVDLEEELDDCDVPTTVIRSKIDCPSSTSFASVADSSISATNDVVVNKLTQILAYLRQGNRGRKWKKKLTTAKDDRLVDPAAEEGIFRYVDAAKGKGVGASETTAFEGGGSGGGGGSGSFTGKGVMKAGGHTGGCEKGEGRGRSRSGSRSRGRGHSRSRSRSPRRDISRDRRDRSRDGRDISKKRGTRVRFADCGKDDGESSPAKQQPPSISAADLIKDINAKFGHLDEAETAKTKSRIIRKQPNDCYLECYPGMGCDDILDSDDEVDYTKMDQGNKKGPVGRWDFETTEEYSNYMSMKEALPKAAFQFGVKMADGRKTRRIKPQNEKQKLEREWKQISQILDQRRGK